MQDRQVGKRACVRAGGKELASEAGADAQEEWGGVVLAKAYATHRNIFSRVSANRSLP